MRLLGLFARKSQPNQVFRWKTKRDGSLADRLFQNSGTGKLQKRLRGDLDNILLKALRKEPSQRYHSVDQFSEDLNRHLLGLPIEAVPHSALYNISRFIKRRKKLLAVSLIVVGLILGAFVITAGEYNEAAKSLARANQSNYVALVEAADVVQIEGGDYANARSVLERTPKAQRRWEWDYLEDAIDSSIQSIRLPAGGTNPYSSWTRTEPGELEPDFCIIVR